MQEFNYDAQVLYVTTLANELSLPTNSVYINSIKAITSARRLLTSTVTVDTHLLVRRNHAVAVSVYATPERIRQSLVLSGMSPTRVTETTVVYEMQYIPIITNKPDDNAMIIVTLALCVISVAGVALFVYVKIHAGPYAYREVSGDTDVSSGTVHPAGLLRDENEKESSGKHPKDSNKDHRET